MSIQEIQRIIKLHESGGEIRKSEAKAVKDYFSLKMQWDKYKHWMDVYKELK